MQLALATWQEVEEYLRAQRGIIVPIGSVEQHGPNGLIGTDHLDAEFVAKGVGDEIGCMVAPTLAYGMSQHHLGFAGSATLRPSTLMLVVRDVVVSLSRHGFERFFFINGHGGNVATVTAAFDEIYAENSLGADRPPIKCRMTFWSGGPRAQKLADEFYGDSNGSHATAAEVSLSHFYHPEPSSRRRCTQKSRPRAAASSTPPTTAAASPTVGSAPTPRSPPQEHGEQLYHAAVEDMVEAYRAFIDY